MAEVCDHMTETVSTEGSGRTQLGCDRGGDGVVD
jgi:hypothetical protein